MHHPIRLAALCAALIPCSIRAADDGWSGTGELGLAIAKGNSDNQTLNAKLGLSRESERWKHSVGTALLYGESDGVESARRYEVSAATAYALGERSVLSGSVRNERDRFAGKEYQWAAAASYGIHALRSERTGLFFEIGPGYRWAKLQGVRVHEDEAIVRGSMDYSHAFNANTSLYDRLLVEAGRDNTFVRNDFGVQVKMSQALALKAGFEVRHNTDVPAGTENTDTLTTVNVVYGF